VSLDLEGDVVQRLDPDEVDRYAMHEEVRQHTDDRSLLVVRSSRHHPARFAWGLPLLGDVVGLLCYPLVALGLLDPVESSVVAVRDPNLEVGDLVSLRVTPVVLDGPVDTIEGDPSEVLLYYPTRDVEPRLRQAIEQTLRGSGRSA